MENQNTNTTPTWVWWVLSIAVGLVVWGAFDLTHQPKSKPDNTQITDLGIYPKGPTTLPPGKNMTLVIGAGGYSLIQAPKHRPLYVHIEQGPEER